MDMGPFWTRQGVGRRVAARRSAVLRYQQAIGINAEKQPVDLLAYKARKEGKVIDLASYRAA